MGDLRIQVALVPQEAEDPAVAFIQQLRAVAAGPGQGNEVLQILPQEGPGAFLPQVHHRPRMELQHQATGIPVPLERSGALVALVLHEPGPQGDQGLALGGLRPEGLAGMDLRHALQPVQRVEAIRTLHLKSAHQGRGTRFRLDDQAGAAFFTQDADGG